MKTKLEMTPLQKVLGFDVAEEVYDQLPLIVQLILDLKIEGYNDSDIARGLGMPRVTVIDTFRRARHTLLKSKLKMILDTRIYYRETHTSVVDDPEIDGNYESDEPGSDRHQERSRHMGKHWRA